TEYTTTWTTTNPDGSVETDSGIVSQSGDSLTTITTFGSESVASVPTSAVVSQFGPHGWNASSGNSSPDVTSSFVGGPGPVETSSSGTTILSSEIIGVSPTKTKTSVSAVDTSAPTVSKSATNGVQSSVSNTVGGTGADSSEGPKVTAAVGESTDSWEPITLASSSASAGSTTTLGVSQSSSQTNSMSTLTQQTSGLSPSSVSISTYEGAGSVVKISWILSALAAMVSVLF
ncbi:hypothetical protein KGF57_004189, partial [Candida theae]